MFNHLLDVYLSKHYQLSTNEQGESRKILPCYMHSDVFLVFYCCDWFHLLLFQETKNVWQKVQSFSFPIWKIKMQISIQRANIKTGVNWIKWCSLLMEWPFLLKILFQPKLFSFQNKIQNVNTFLSRLLRNKLLFLTCFYKNNKNWLKDMMLRVPCP